jgi:hypothetical protein
MNWFNNLLILIKNLLISFFIRISLSFSRIENTLLKNDQNTDHTNNGKEIKNIQSDLLKSLYNGVYNVEYVKKFYKILKLADDKIYNIYNLEFDKRKTDNTDNNEIIRIVKNNIEIKNPENVIILNEKPLKFTTIKSRDNDRVYKIEEITDYLHIKKYKNNKVLLEFYIHEENYIEEHFEELLKIKNIHYTDKYGDNIEYNVIEFYKSNKYNFNHVLKFIGKEI